MNNYQSHNASKRIVIIHRHFFKNAGTTFDTILERNFGSCFCDHRDDIPMRQIGPEYLVRYLRENPDIKALSSHHIWFNMPVSNDLKLISIMFLRHPIERMRSVYNFERKQASDTIGSKMAKLLSFKDYVLWYMKDETPATIRDFHIRHLAGIKSVKPMKYIHFLMAKRQIKNNPLIGVVELFDRSLQLFDEVLKDLGFELDMRCQAKNVSQPLENADYDKRAQEVLDELGNAAEEVRQKNAFDLELYRLAKNKILSASANISEK